MSNISVNTNKGKKLKNPKVSFLSLTGSGEFVYKAQVSRVSAIKREWVQFPP